jgi:hypothetical protein
MEGKDESRPMTANVKKNSASVRHDTDRSFCAVSPQNPPQSRNSLCANALRVNELEAERIRLQVGRAQICGRVGPKGDPKTTPIPHGGPGWSTVISPALAISQKRGSLMKAIVLLFCALAFSGISSSQSFTENFSTQANQNPLNSALWTTVTGGLCPLQVLSGQAISSTITAQCASAYTGGAFPSDQYVRFTLGTLTGDGANEIGIFGREGQVSNSGYYLFIYQTGTMGGSVLLQVVDQSGGINTLGSANATVNTGDVFQMNLIGDHITVAQNGTQIISVIDSTDTAGAPGVISNTFDAVQNAGITSFSAGSLVPPPAPAPMFSQKDRKEPQVIPANYFNRPETPAGGSPIARIMRQLDVLYPEMPAEQLRAVANERIHSNGPGQVKWSRDESKRLKEGVVLAGRNQAERFLPNTSVLVAEDRAQGG